MQDITTARSNPQRSAEMRSRLIAAARKLFVAEGYVNTSTPAIVNEAGVTRGALYHHFPDKQAIFHAVLEREAQEIVTAIEASDQTGMSAVDRLLAGASAYLRAMRQPGRVRLMLIDGPAVLGTAAMRAIDREHGDASLKEGLQEALEESEITALPLDTLSSFISAMFERAAIDAMAGVEIEEQIEVINAVIKGLFDPSSGERGTDFGRTSQG